MHYFVEVDLKKNLTLFFVINQNKLFFIFLF